MTTQHQQEHHHHHHRPHYPYKHLLRVFCAKGEDKMMNSEKEKVKITKNEPFVALCFSVYFFLFSSSFVSVNLYHLHTFFQ